MAETNGINEGYTILSDSESRLFAVDPYFFSPMAILLAIIIITILSQHLNSSAIDKNNKYYALAVKCAIGSACCTAIACALKTFFCNNLFIAWDYTNGFAGITDSLFAAFYMFGKIIFYFGFTFQIQSVIYSNQSDNNDKKAAMPLLIKIWMILVAISVTIMCVLWTYGDAVENSNAEIGITSIPGINIYISLYNGHEGAPLAKMGATLFMITDMIYFVILVYYYLSSLKKLNKFSKEGVKGFILMLSASIVFWIGCIIVVTNSPLRYIAIAISIIFDDICLFLMFKCGDQIYQKLFGCCCNQCCGKIIFGSSYQPIPNVDDNNDDDAL